MCTICEPNWLMFSNRLWGKEAWIKEIFTFDSDGNAERILNNTKDLIMQGPAAKFEETLAAFIDDAEQLNSIDRLNAQDQ